VDSKPKKIIYIGFGALSRRCLSRFIAPDHCIASKSLIEIVLSDFDGGGIARDNVPVFSYMKNGDRLSCILGNKQSNWRGFRLRDVLNDETQNAKLNSKKSPGRCEN